MIKNTNMSGKLPYRKNIEPLSQIVADLEKIKINRRDVTKISKKNYDHGHGKGKSTEDPVANAEKEHFLSLIEAKDKQIDKLVEKLSALYNYNNKYAVDNEKLQKEVLILQQNFDSLKSLTCDNCDALMMQREQYLKENSDLKDDVKMMKTLVYRLNVQLEQNQETLRKLNIKDRTLNKIEFETQIPKEELNWGNVNSHTLAPLLNAYQEFLNDKNDLIQQYEDEINNFTGDFKATIEENDSLQVELSNLKRAHENWKNDRTRLQAQLDICRNKAEVQTRRADLTKDKLVEVMKCYEKKIQSQSLDIERLQDAYAKTKNELTTLKSLQEQPQVIIDSLRECQKLFEELKIQHDAEQKRLLSEIENLKKSSNEDGKSSQKLKSNYSELKHSIAKQKEMNDLLNQKNETLRHSLNRIRHSRESLKKRLKASTVWSRSLEGSQTRINSSWNELQQIQSLLEQKESQMRTMRMRYSSEIENLTRKLKQREETLKKILQEKVNSKLKK